MCAATDVSDLFTQLIFDVCTWVVSDFPQSRITKTGLHLFGIVSYSEINAVRNIVLGFDN